LERGEVNGRHLDAQRATEPAAGPCVRIRARTPSAKVDLHCRNARPERYGRTWMSFFTSRTPLTLLAKSPAR
jgi:hypothetical protein